MSYVTLKFQDSLLIAIREDYVDGVDCLLRFEEDNHQPGTPYSWESIDQVTANFTSDITPLILAGKIKLNNCRKNKTGVINDPFGQTHNLASIVLALYCFARFWKVGTDVRTDNLFKTMIPTGRDCGVAEWIKT